MKGYDVEKYKENIEILDFFRELQTKGQDYQANSIQWDKFIPKHFGIDMNSGRITKVFSILIFLFYYLFYFYFYCYYFEIVLIKIIFYIIREKFFY